MPRQHRLAGLDSLCCVFGGLTAEGQHVLQSLLGRHLTDAVHAPCRGQQVSREHSQFDSSLMDLIAEVEDMVAHPVQPQHHGPGLGGPTAGQHGPPSGRQSDWSNQQFQPKLGSKDCKQSSDVPGVGPESCCLLA